MQRLIYIFIIVCFSSSLLAQQETVYFGDEGVFEKQDTSLFYDKSPRKTNKNLSFRLNSGALYSSLYGSGLFTSYVAPEINYKLTNDFSISVGTMMSVNTMPSFMQWQDNNNAPLENRTASYYMFAKGEYMVNENLRIKASTVFDVGANASNYSNSSRFAYSSFGFDYKIGEDTYISAEINIHNYNPKNPMFYNPVDNYFNNPYTRPFGNSLYSEPFTTW